MGPKSINMCHSFIEEGKEGSRHRCPRAGCVKAKVETAFAAVTQAWRGRPADAAQRGSEWAPPRPLRHRGLRLRASGAGRKEPSAIESHRFAGAFASAPGDEGRAEGWLSLRVGIFLSKTTW